MRPARQISSFSYSVMQGSALGQYERYMLRRYFLAVLVQFTREEQGRLPEDLLIWYAQNETLLQINIPKLKQYASAARRDRLAGNPVLKLTLAQAERHYGTMPPPSAFQKRVDWVAKTLSLDPIEKASLGAISRLIQLEPFSDFAAAAGGRWIEERDEVPAKFICTLLGLSRGSARRIFQHQGTLQKLGLLEDRGGDDFRPSDFIQKLLRQRTTDERILEQTLLTENYAPSLSLNDFDHMSEERDQLIAILRGCLDQREKGAGILLHGAPGTGKTEFAALLGQACSARIIFAGETDREGGEPSRHERIAHLSLLSAIGSRAGRVIVVVDEADDIFSGVDSEETFRPTGKRTGSKAFINRMVENCSIPTVWISNHPERMGASVVRRMLYAAEFRKPGAQIRRRIVDRHAETLNVPLDEMSRANLARLPVAPAIIASSLRATSLGHGNGAMALATAKSLQNALGEARAPHSISATRNFDPSLCSADADLNLIQQSIVKAGHKPFSFLLTGIPGTGKTAFAHHLAGCLKMEVLEKRASDLLGKYVGESEGRIAGAFREAVSENAFLIFDEADSLLFDRRQAQHSWQISQVNEMLTWMECHPLPYAATSNLLERLDPAVQRRFTFKARFDAMTASQISHAFLHYFNAQAPEDLLSLQPLVPGDFAVVARQAALLEIEDSAELAAMLEREVLAKEQAGRRIGFF